MKAPSMNDNEVLDDLRHDEMYVSAEDMSSYRAGDSVADTIVASSSRSNQKFIVRPR
jgi:hypothetical protein